MAFGQGFALTFGGQDILLQINKIAKYDAAFSAESGWRFVGFFWKPAIYPDHPVNPV